MPKPRWKKRSDIPAESTRVPLFRTVLFDTFPLPQIMYRIAKGLVKNLDKYAVRKEFEKALVSEAQYLIENGDSAKFAKEDLEKAIYETSKPEDKFMDTSDIAPETKRTLNFLGFDRWFSLVQIRRLNKDEY